MARDTKPITVKAGQVWRIRSRAAQPFSDMTVLGMASSRDGTVYVRLARPYLYASLVGTTGPTAMIGFETVDVALHRLADWAECVSDDAHFVTAAV